MDALPEFLPIINSVSVVGVVVFVLRIVVRGTWLHRSTHDQIVSIVQERLEETRADRDYWRGFGLRVTEVAEKAADVADVVVGKEGNGKHL